MSRITRITLRLLPVLGLLLLVGAAFGYPKVQSQAKAKTKAQVINTGGPVETRECTPCHDDLNDFDNPDLINFKHEVHFKRGVKCDACHVVFPHQPQGLVKPTMDLCINCHRLDHSQQGEMAPGQCELCHPSDFDLKPSDHGEGDFAGAGHVAGAEADLQKCLVCHTGETCESCHSQQGIAPREAADYRWYSLLPIAKTEGQNIYIGGSSVTMGLCQPCHLDLTKWENDNLVNFNHAAHFKKQIDCGKCHESWPHEPGRVAKPKMDTCARCHRLDHGEQGQLVKAESKDYCLLCHPKEMELKPEWHTDEFIDGGHQDRAKADRGECRVCHVQETCDNCHQTEIPHEPDWRSDHGVEASAPSEIGEDGQLTCVKCHETEPSTKTAPPCAECHKADVYPHPEPWAPEHGKIAKTGGQESCMTCHVEKAFCRACHGDLKMPHRENWLSEHNEPAREDGNVCMNCHEAGQCEQCHASHKLHNQYSNFDFKVKH